MRRCWSGGILDARDQTLIVSAEAVNIPLLILDLCLDIVNSIRGLDLEGNSLSGESLYENLHGCRW